MYKSDFTSLFLDNYIKMSPKVRANGSLQGLTMNMKQLLATKYCTVGSQLSFKYEAFVEDMRRKEAENKGGIKIYMT